jgi:hypothetical protein
MSDPTLITVDLNEILESLERLYMIQHERGFARPKPKLLNPDDRAAADIPSGFLEWWKGHDNCDINPVVAWKTARFRNQFYRNPKGYSQSLSD